MGTLTKSICWNESRPLRDLFAEAQAKRVDYLIAEAEPNPATNETAITAGSSADLIVFRDESETKRWSGLDACLPTHLYFLAALPADHTRIAISVTSLAANPGLLTESHSLSELVARLAATATTAFVDRGECRTGSRFRYPPLIQAGSERGQPWVHSLIDKIPAAKDRASSMAVTALKAGLFLMNNCVDESHACSQSIEGLGPHHTGDYWHAILHRREPDYGNAKYWFRHVGRHPAYVELAHAVRQYFNESEGKLPANLRSWKSKLLPGDMWDPFAFVDLCSVAEMTTTEHRAWCEYVQYEEMCLLLASTAREATQNLLN